MSGVCMCVCGEWVKIVAAVFTDRTQHDGSGRGSLVQGK